MTTPLPTFSGQVKWANGGCLVCGANYNDAGKKALGVQGVSLDVDDDLLGTFALCYSHALHVGRAVGMVPQTTVDEAAQDITSVLEKARELQEQAAADAAQARLDKDTVERLLGSVYQPADEPAEPFGAGVGA